ncbi:MAG: AI-2E family transporter [Eubacterium sp.]|nr:AI-2E family transporter [Eubacterium sp.]
MGLFKDKKAMRIVKAGSVLILLYFVLNNLGMLFGVLRKVIKVCMPFIIGAAMAYILNVPMRRVEQGFFRNREKYNGEKWDKRRRVIALTITLFLTILVFALVAYLVIPQLIDTIAQLVRQIPSGIKNVTKWAEGLFVKYPDIYEKIESWAADWQNILQKVMIFVRDKLSDILAGGINAVSGIVSGLLNFIIGFIFSIYILLQKEKLSDQCMKLLYTFLEKKHADWWMNVADRADKTFTGFVSGQCVEAIIIGIMFFIVMTIFRLPYTLLISITIAVLALIPIVGTIIGCLVGCILILLVAPVKVLVFVIIFIVIQQIEGNFIYPFVVGNSVGLPGIWVLVSLTVGGSLFGVAGMVVFIPLVSVLYALFREYVHDKLMEKGMLTADYKLKVVREKKEDILETKAPVKRRGRRAAKAVQDNTADNKAADEKTAESSAADKNDKMTDGDKTDEKSDIDDDDDDGDDDSLDDTPTEKLIENDAPTENLVAEKPQQNRTSTPRKKRGSSRRKR